MHSRPSKRVSTIGYCLGSGLNLTVAPLATCRLTLLFRWIAPVRNTPSGTTTRPPPALAAASMAARMAAVESALPSGLPPKRVKSKSRFGNFGDWILARRAGRAAQGSSAARAARRAATAASAASACLREQIGMNTTIIEIPNAEIREVLPGSGRPFRASGQGAAPGLSNGGRTRRHGDSGLEQVESRAPDRRLRARERARRRRRRRARPRLEAAV